MTTTESATAEERGDFIRDIITADLASGKYKEIVTRFPPEPNGYLHIGHAKSIALNFGIAQEFQGHCNLRFDDTNPAKEEQEYIDSIQADVRWLGYDWAGEPLYASDYFDRLYEWAEGLIRHGLAYVDDQSQHDIRVNRGTLTEPGKASPFRDRSVEENLDLFRRMKAGEFPNGARVLRAKIDMGAGNINLRDPVLYRILHAHHPRTGAKWSIYPSGDYRTLPLWSERVILAVAEHQTLGRNGAIRWPEVANERMLLPRHGPGPEARLNCQKPASVSETEGPRFSSAARSEAASTSRR